MGSVQSGKTASMLGVAALSLDRKVDIVVVLAGTSLSLWQQTLDRLQRQLDVGEESAEKQRRRILLPVTPPATAISLASRYQLTPVRVQRAMRRQQPIIIVSLKHAGHLQALRRSLAESVYDVIDGLDRPVHMLVLDDEADDGSILDANVEASQDPWYGNLKQIPRAIVDLWSPPSQLAPSNLFATYVGYTATPQANFLQEEHNPLAPRDFLAALRTPLDRGDISDRSSTFTEPQGISKYYTGGETYYSRGREAGLCIPTTWNRAEDLGDSIRAFLVAGAVRLCWENPQVGPVQAARTSFRSAEEVTIAAPKPHSMLIHPSPLVGEQFRVAEDVLLWAGAASREDARARLTTDNGLLPISLTSTLDVEEEKWSCWLDRYTESAQRIHSEFNTPNPQAIPSWQTVKDLLRREVIPGTRVAVVNSDDGADSRPEYEPVQSDDGTWRAPRDMFTIFVSGNVMSRGLTLEGLTTTLFLRTSDSPVADTQMQMQRWFGYRGRHIELCRVFAPRSQIDFFTDYHDVDEALRTVVTNAMKDDAEVPSPLVLQGQEFLATGKISNLGNKPLCPGRKPFVRVINAGNDEDPNSRLVADLFRTAASAEVTTGARVRGRVLTDTLSLSEAADLLDQLEFHSYRPGTDNWQSVLWSQVQERVNAIQALPNGQRLYRPTEPVNSVASPVRKDCPYAIPAYMRLWEACLSRRVRGLFVTGRRDDLWSMVSLEEKRRQQPRFWVGIRYGSGPIAAGPLSDLPFDVPVTQKAVVNGQISTTWGANDPNAGAAAFRGDEYFDYYHRGEEVPRSPRGEERWRPAGSDGLILFYINQVAGQPHPTVAVGVCIPAGGPDQFAAYTQQLG
ncbi:Z1 domain-containing protein [Pseudarthrobacter enclensis]|uniref:Z1 domain-containing protein n=1 Tax=Pseudarthrobacter enclensis TaxID=993070 RepID=UPI003EE38467